MLELTKMVRNMNYLTFFAIHFQVELCRVRQRENFWRMAFSTCLCVIIQWMIETRQSLCKPVGWWKRRTTCFSRTIFATLRPEKFLSFGTLLYEIILLFRWLDSFHGSCRWHELQKMRQNNFCPLILKNISWDFFRYWKIRGSQSFWR